MASRLFFIDFLSRIVTYNNLRYSFRTYYSNILIHSHVSLVSSRIIFRDHQHSYAASFDSPTTPVAVQNYVHNLAKAFRVVLC